MYLAMNMLSQIDAAAFAHAEQSWLASRRVLSSGESEPSGTLAPLAERGAVADGSHGCGGHQRSDSGYTALPMARPDFSVRSSFFLAC